MPTGDAPNGYSLSFRPVGPLTLAGVLWLSWAQWTDADVAPESDVDVTVSWGDGQSQVVTLPTASPWSAELSHTYAAAGTYTVTASGSAGPTAGPPYAYAATLPPVAAVDAFPETVSSLLSPFAKAANVTPDDLNDLPTVSRGIEISGGTARVTTAGGSVVILTAGEPRMLPLRVRRVWSTGTTGSVVVLW